MRQWAAEAEALAAIAVDPSLAARLADGARRLLRVADDMAARHAFTQATERADVSRAQLDAPCPDEEFEHT